jgi:hypothetical protein
MLGDSGLLKTPRAIPLIGGVVIGGAIFLVPILIFVPNQVPAPMAVAQFVACGVLLGLGRQGIDVLEVRLFTASLGLLLGAVISQQQAHVGAACPDPTTCAQSVLLGSITIGLLGMLVLSLVAVPTTILWARGTAQLKPELNWAAVKWWQWLVLGVLAVAVFAFTLGIPSP